MSSSSWKEVRLGDLVSVKHGWPFRSELFSEQLTGRPIIVSIGNFRYTGGFRFESTTVKEYRGDYPAEYELKPADILLVMTCQTEGGEILGLPARVPNDGKTYLHNQRMGKVVVAAPQLVDADFLYYVFLWRDFNQELVASATGTKIVHTAPSRIEAFRFQLPPIRTQQAIGELLRAIDDKIASNHRLSRLCLELAIGQFRSLFVDFDQSFLGLDLKPSDAPSCRRHDYPVTSEQSTLGPIPLGWRVANLDSIGEFMNGLALQNFPAGTGESLPVVKIAQLRVGTTDTAEMCSAAIPSNYVIQNGDLIFSWSGSLLADFWCGGTGALNQHLFKVTSAAFPKWFCWGWVEYHMPTFQAIAADKATTMGHIRRHHLTDAKVVVPPADFIAAADAVQAPLVDKLIAARVENHTLAKLRDTLLPPLMSGELRIKDAEKIVGKAV